MAKSIAENLFFYMLVLFTGALMLLGLYSVVKRRGPNKLLMISLAILASISLIIFMILAASRIGKDRKKSMERDTAKS